MTTARSSSGKAVVVPATEAVVRAVDALPRGVALFRTEGEQLRLVYLNAHAIAHSVAGFADKIGTIITEDAANEISGLGPQVLQGLRRAALDGTTLELPEVPLSPPGGETRWISVILSPAGSGTAMAVFEDITDHRRAHAQLEAIKDALELEVEQQQRDLAEVVGELRRSEQRFADLYDNAPDGFASIDARTRKFINCNQTLLDRLGYSREEFLGRPFAFLYSEEDLGLANAAFQTFLREGRLRDEPLRMRTRNGEPVEVLMSTVGVRDQRGEIVSTRATFRDVTEQRRLQAQLDEAQRLEAVGRLAGGIAHDFNNLLTVVMTHAEMLISGEHESEVARGHGLEEIVGAARRGAELVRQLLAVGRRQVMRPRIVDINAVVRGLSSLLESVVGRKRTFALDLDDEPATCLCDPAQMERVLINLVTNAKDATPPDGTITVQTRVRAGDGDEPADDLVVLAVSDTGAGMDLEVQRRVFEPFFTTKPLGAGSGLGLATVHGIVGQSGGKVVVHSAPGEGTTFEVLLPRAEPD